MVYVNTLVKTINSPMNQLDKLRPDSAITDTGIVSVLQINPAV